MIVLDSSVLAGIIKGEPDAERLLDLLASEECAIGASTLVETRACMRAAVVQGRRLGRRM